MYNGREMIVSQGKDGDGDIKMTPASRDLSGIKAISDALSVSASLTELSISGNSIGDEGKKAIGATVGSSMQRLVCDTLDLRADATQLDLHSRGLGPGDAALIAGGLRAFMASLTRLDVSLNHMDRGGNGVQLLRDAVRQREGFVLIDADND